MTATGSSQRAAASSVPDRAKRTRMTPEARRAQLIELGLDMLSTQRLEELSVEAIADAAGISRGLLFHYFASKQEFHTEVARAAAQEMLRRTEPAADATPSEALHAALTGFVEYVEQNPDNYKSLVRGAASGDAEMRTIFDETRIAMAQRILGVVDDLGIPVNPAAELAVHGWVAYAEECTVRWIDNRSIDRAELLQLLETSLPAVAAVAMGAAAQPLMALFTSGQG